MQPQIFLTCLPVLEEQMNKYAVESGEHHKILEQMAPFGVAWPHTPRKDSDVPCLAVPYKPGATSAQGQTQMVGCCGAISPWNEEVNSGEGLLRQ